MNRVRSRYYGQLERERERHMAKKFNFLSASKSFCDCAKIKLSHPIYHVTLLLNHIFGIIVYLIFGRAVYLFCENQFVN